MRGWWLALASTACAAAIALLAAELVVLPWMLGAPRDLALLGLVGRGERVDDTPLNSLGFTGAVPAAEKPPGVRRILTLGGSSLFNHRMTERLQAAIAARSPQPVEVLGAALRTHTSRADVVKYAFLSRYEFDYVFLYEGINDLWANHVTAERFRDDYAHLNPWYRRTFLLDHSLVARVVYNAASRPWTSGLEDFLTKNGRHAVNGADFASAGTLERNLRELIAAVRRDGGVPILMTFAWNIPEDYSREAFEADALGYVNPDGYEHFPAELWGPVGFVREGLRRHDEVVRRVARETDTLLLDQQAYMAGRIELFSDPCHFNEAGTDVFVQRMVDLLAERGFI